MNDAVSAKRTLVVLSPDYLDVKAVFSHAEWAATFVQDPEGRKGTLLPVRVRECQPTELLATITYIDLVNQPAKAARDILLEGVRFSSKLPTVEPIFPGETPATLATVPDFPGNWPVVWTVPYNRNPFFTGREEILSCLHEMLTTQKGDINTSFNRIRWYW